LRSIHKWNTKRRAPAAWRFFSSRLVLAAVFLAGCRNPFSTRTPEPPVTSAGWTPPLHPEEVLDRLQEAVNGRNADYFIRCFSDPAYTGRLYQFEPDPETAAAHPEIFRSWNRDKEQAVMQQAFYLTPKDSACSLTWTASVREFITPDSAVFVRRYRLALHHGRQNLPPVYEGDAEFWLAEDRSGAWAVYRWIDNSVSGPPSWSFLKASLGG
jgi:hypothetical protein